MQDADHRDDTDLDLQAEVARLRGLLDAAQETLSRNNEIAAAEQARLTFELGHRVKNTLSVVQALASQTKRSTADKNEAFETLGQRIIALARANDVILKESWTSTSLDAVATGALESFAAGPDRLTIEGPSVRLAASRALSLAMALHELGANAKRHGGWSTPEGRVELVWRILPADPDPMLLLVWTESGGPPPVPPPTPGFGLRLAEQSLRSAFGRDITLDFRPTGLVCTARTPLGALAA